MISAPAIVARQSLRDTLFFDSSYRMRIATATFEGGCASACCALDALAECVDADVRALQDLPGWDRTGRPLGS
jgi:hypothetical protein